MLQPDGRSPDQQNGNPTLEEVTSHWICQSDLSPLGIAMEENKTSHTAQVINDNLKILLRKRSGTGRSFWSHPFGWQWSYGSYTLSKVRAELLPFLCFRSKLLSTYCGWLPCFRGRYFTNKLSVFEITEEVELVLFLCNADVPFTHAILRFFFSAEPHNVLRNFRPEDAVLTHIVSYSGYVFSYIAGWNGRICLRGQNRLQTL
jgi:hypothetical protein